MGKEHLQGKQITMPRALWDALEELGRELHYADGRGVHSRLVREMVSAAVTKWRESPYVCRSAHLVALVTRSGHIFYRLVQVLKLNSKRDRLPCILEMKPEKRKDDPERPAQKLDEAGWFRSRWLLNYFAVWHGEATSGQPLDSFVDHDGIHSKMADLWVRQGPGRVLTRELVVGLEGYVQWQQEGERDYDRLELPIDVPTQNLDVTVIVDAELYRNTPSLTDGEIPELEVEFRNRECARFDGEALAYDAANPIEAVSGRHPPGSVKGDQAKSELQALAKRIKTLAAAEAANGPVVAQESRRALLTALEVPKRFLFCKLSWPSPYFGLAVCVRWEKPAAAPSPELVATGPAVRGKAKRTAGRR